MVTSKRAYTKGDLPGLLLLCPRPCGEPLRIRLHRRPSSTSRWFRFRLLWGLCFTPEFWCTHGFVCALHDWRLYPPVLWSNLAGLKVTFPGDSWSLRWFPRLGSLTWGSEPSQQWGNFFGIVLQFVGHPPSGYGIWFYRDCAPPAVLLWFFICLWPWSIIFGRFQRWWSLVGCRLWGRTESDTTEAT